MDIELEFGNCLKLYELGKTDEELFQRQYEWYMREKGRVDQYIIKKKEVKIILNTHQQYPIILNTTLSHLIIIIPIFFQCFLTCYNN